MSSALLLFPNQLYEVALKRDTEDIVILVEDDLFFKQYSFHKQKLILHRASMQVFTERLQKAGRHVELVRTQNAASMTLLADTLKRNKVTDVVHYELVDDWLEQRLQKILESSDINRETLPTPAFLTSRGQLESYFSERPDRMQSFYEWQRKRLDIMVENGKPLGGAWSYDEKNRKPLPKDVVLPPKYDFEPSEAVSEAIDWATKEFADNPGGTNFNYPVTHAQASQQLDQFLHNRLVQFGPYEDAIAAGGGQVFHSALSAALNIGLLTPRQVVTRTLNYASEHDIPIESVEGFIRQIIGWREYMRATYVRYGREMRTTNQFKFTRKLTKDWWRGTTGLDPIDTTIKHTLETAYAHHIERLMIIGNGMLLLRFAPDEVYEWFMSLFIDAYDWVMVPNVYAMSQFAVGNKITTKPYISGSNYVLKMSDYKRGDWCDDWDALYWRFVADHRELFENNYRSAMMIRLYDKLTPAKKRAVTQRSNKWLP